VWILQPELPPDLPPIEEAKRLAALRRYDILDTPPDDTFDRITALAARLCAVPISIISLVDHDRIWFKSHHGLAVEQIARTPGLCASAILQTDPWIVCDAKTDGRVRNNPLVTGDLGLRFYIGIPLRTHDGFNIGTLCVIDREPHTPRDWHIAHLKDLASIVVDRMELLFAARRAIGELMQVNSEKEAALRRSDLLAKELEHRVMNGLQLVSATLTLQGRASRNPDVAKQLLAAADRVGAIAQVHRHIYLGDAIESVDCRQYLQRLCAALSDMLRSPDGGIIVCESLSVHLPTERIVSIGLIVSELVTNAAKHGAGRIKVAFTRTPAGDFSLSVSDEGAGLPQAFDPTSAPGLGLKVVYSLAQKLGGRVGHRAATPGRGTQFFIEFPDVRPPSA